MHAILHQDLGLEKKSARWVPELLSNKKKQQCFNVCTNLVAAVHCCSLPMVDSIVTMDETMMSYCTWKTKKQSLPWIKKGQPGPINAKVHASRTKQTLLAFFDSKGLIYTLSVTRDASTNAIYIIKVLGIFTKQLRMKRPEMVCREWFSIGTMLESTPPSSSRTG
jgi:hypothetical protein